MLRESAFGAFLYPLRYTGIMARDSTGVLRGWRQRVPQGWLRAAMANPQFQGILGVSNTWTRNSLVMCLDRNRWPVCHQKEGGFMSTASHPTVSYSLGVRLLIACGAIGPSVFIIVFLIEGATRPGYSAWHNFVS